MASERRDFPEKLLADDAMQATTISNGAHADPNFARDEPRADSRKSFRVFYDK